MDIVWITHYILATLSLLALFAVSYVDGLRCHVCDGLSNNEKCNSNFAECTNSEHDACFTLVEKYDSFGKRYTKGCTNYAECKKLENLNDARTCSRTPSKCHYCCKKTKCNEYNRASSWGTPFSLFATLGCVAWNILSRALS